MRSVHIFAILLIAMVYSEAQTTTQWRLIWDKNLEPDMKNYDIFKDTHPDATTIDTTIDHTPRVGIDTTMEYIDTDILPGIQYYYRLKARDQSGLTSNYSAEVSAAIPQITWNGETLMPGKTTTYHNDRFYTDPDQASGHTRIITYQDHLIVTLTTDSVRITPDPISYTGPASFTMAVIDEDEFQDEATGLEITFYFTFGTPTNVNIEKKQ